MVFSAQSYNYFNVTDNPFPEETPNRVNNAAEPTKLLDDRPANSYHLNSPDEWATAAYNSHGGHVLLDLFR